MGVGQSHQSLTNTYTNEVCGSMCPLQLTAESWVRLPPAGGGEFHERRHQPGCFCKPGHTYCCQRWSVIPSTHLNSAKSNTTYFCFAAHLLKHTSPIPIPHFIQEFEFRNSERNTLGPFWRDVAGANGIKLKDVEVHPNRAAQ